MQSSNPLFSVSMQAGWRRNLWLAIIVATSLLFSLVFACATPFAALAVIAAATLSRRDALICILSVWLINQLVGFTMLAYPQTANAFIWGGVMGLAAMVCVLAANAASAFLKQHTVWMRLAGAFFASLIAYEVVLLMAALTPLGGVEDFTFAIIGRVVSVNVLALGGMVGVSCLAIAGGLIPVSKKLPA